MDGPTERGSPTPDDPDTVVLRAGCHPRYARVVRTVCASCASLQDFSIDRIGDVRLLADEVFNAVGALGASAVVFRLRAVDGALAIEVEADRDEGASQPEEALQLVAMMSSVIAPGAELSVEPRRVRFVAAIVADPA
jgi:hypothetical protein